jgi:hypothetical protein
MTVVAVLNHSSVVTDAEIAAMVPALQQQVSTDFAPAWGTDAHVTFVANKQRALKGAWQLVVLDDSTQAGALGFHDLTAAGLPISKVFAKSDLAYNASVSVTVSHELLEMLLDPWINTAAQHPDGVSWYAYEACDAVEADVLGYKIGGVLVSDFVLPPYFEPQPAPHSRFSFRQSLTKPFSLAAGGYSSVWKPGTGWTQVNAEEVPHPRHRPKVGSRRERRRTPVSQWMRSTAG